MAIESGNAERVTRAGHGCRIAHFVLDHGFFFVLSMIAWVALGILAETGGFSIAWLNRHRFVTNGLALAAYFFFFEALFARTPAKFVTGTLVVAEDNQPPSLAQIVVRTLCRFIPLEALSFLGRRASGWHDQWSRTGVVLKPSIAARKNKTRHASSKTERPADNPVGNETLSIASQELIPRRAEQPDFMIMFSDGTRSEWVGRDTLLQWLSIGKVTDASYVYARQVGDWQLLRDVDGIASVIPHPVADVFSDSAGASPRTQTSYQTEKIRVTKGTTAAGADLSLEISDLHKARG